MTQVKGSGQVDIEYVLPVLKRKFGAGVAALYAGGIDQNIQAAQQSDGLVKGLLPGTVVGQVHGDAFAPIALCFELGGHLDHLFAGTKNDYSGAGLHQALRHAVAQSSSAAGDNSLFPGEIK